MKNLPLLFVIGLLLGACHLTDRGTQPEDGERIHLETEHVFGGDGFYFPMDVSPDEQKILVGHQSQTGIFDIRSGNLKMLTSGPTMYSPVAFSPDGNRILYTSGPRFQTMDTTGGDHRKVLPPGVGASSQNPVGYSPEGDLILFNKIVNHDGDGMRIFITESEGGIPRQLTDVPSRAVDFSPDGRKILFMRMIDGERSVWIMDADGSSRKRISEEGSNAFPLQFSGNSRSILYMQSGGRDQIMVSDTAGTDKQKVVEGSLLMPAALSHDGRIIAYYEGAGTGICPRCSVGEMYLIRSNGTGKTEIDTGYFHPGGNIRFLSDNRTFVHSASYNGTTLLMLSVMDAGQDALTSGQ